MITRGGGRAAAGAGDRLGQFGQCCHSGAPNRLVTCRNQDSERRLALLYPVDGDPSLSTRTRFQLGNDVTRRTLPAT